MSIRPTHATTFRRKCLDPLMGFSTISYGRAAPSSALRPSINLAFNLATQEARPEHVSAARVDGEFFQTFQSSPQLGRAITADDNQPAHDKVAIISHALWQSMFGSAADILHRPLLLDSKSYEIIGVMPEGFEYPHFSDLPYGVPQYKITQVWIPLALTPHAMADRDNSSGVAVARLKPGVSIAQAPGPGDEAPSWRGSTSCTTRRCRDGARISSKTSSTVPSAMSARCCGCCSVQCFLYC